MSIGDHLAVFVKDWVLQLDTTFLQHSPFDPYFGHLHMLFEHSLSPFDAVPLNFILGFDKRVKRSSLFFYVDLVLRDVGRENRVCFEEIHQILHNLGLALAEVASDHVLQDLRHLHKQPLGCGFFVLFLKLVDDYLLLFHPHCLKLGIDPPQVLDPISKLGL